MRVTNSMLVSNLMRNLGNNLTRMDKLLNQEATGRKFAHISDDPTALIYAQSARNKIARLENYQRTVQTAQNWLTQAEDGVMELQKVLVHAYELTVDAASDAKGTGDESDKRNIAPAIGQLRDHFLDTLNMTFGDKFVFGGYNTPGDPTYRTDDQGVKAFTVETGAMVDVFGNPQIGRDGNPMVELDSDGNPVLDAGGNQIPLTGPRIFYNGYDMSQFDGMTLADFRAYSDPSFDVLKNDILKFDVGMGVSMPVTMNGIELLFFITPGDDAETPIIRNAWNVLQDVYELCDDGAPATEIGKMIKPLQDAQNHLLTKTSEIGGRVRRLDLLEARYEQDAINYERMRSDAEDVDMAEVILYLKMAEAVYQAALSAGARIIQPTLMDFLR